MQLIAAEEFLIVCDASVEWLHLIVLLALKKITSSAFIFVCVCVCKPRLET